jgi:hypothetical protein
MGVVWLALENTVEVGLLGSAGAGMTDAQEARCPVSVAP